MVMPDQTSLYLHNAMNNFPNNSLFFELVLCLSVFSSLRFVRDFSHLFGGTWNFFEFVWFVVDLVGFLYVCG